MVARAIAAATVLTSLCLAGATGGPEEEDLLAGRRVWARDANSIQAAVDKQVRHDQKPSVRIEHRGKQDWSLESKARVDVQEGDLLELAAWVKVQGQGEAGISVVTYGKDGKVVEWMFGSRSVRGPHDWGQLRSRFVVPRNVVAVLPRLTGTDAATVWMEGQGLLLEKKGNLKAMRDKDLPESLTITNDALSVTLHTADAALSVLDRRTKQTWTQKPVSAELVMKGAKVGDGLEMSFIYVPTGQDVKAALRLDGNSPEFTFALSADGELPKSLAFPHPFATEKGTYLVVPMNEGISYPVEDQSISPMRLIAYGGHGICMAFWGATDGEKGHMAIIETADDCSIGVRRVDGKLCIGPEWDSQKGKFGYERRVRYVFFDRGGHVVMCKRYRAHARKTGLLKTFEQKRKSNPNIDLLIGAVNVWCWDRDPVPIVKEMRASGIERILWSNAGRPENIQAMNEMPGVLTSRYDIYQDVMNPENFKLLRGIHGDWPTEAWPKDIMIGPRGDWIKGWAVRTKDGNMVSCGVVCDRQAIAYAEKRIPEDLKTRPYRSRFIDTTTASPWRECYEPNHPMTRGESRHYKMELLRLVSEKYKLVTGCETGHDASVPYVDYFEGMLSLGPYRVPDSGRDMQRIWDEVPQNVAKFQLGHQYRLPLWELVYHDCVVAQWYWGDYNNKLPALWDKRDLFNALYGTPPMFMFSREFWEKNRDRFVQSYRNTCPVARATGYSEMTDHRFLTADRAVQQTTFANGVTVTVNFGDASYKLPDGTDLAPKGLHVGGIRK